MLHTHAEEKRVRVRPDVGARRLGQDEQYLTVREIVSEASTLADGALSRERSDFYRFGYATLGFTLDNVENGTIPSEVYWSNGVVEHCKISNLKHQVSGCQGRKKTET
jgi:hypothetical protein